MLTTDGALGMMFPPLAYAIIMKGVSAILDLYATTTEWGKANGAVAEDF